MFYNTQKPNPIQLYDSLVPSLSHTKRYKIKEKVEEKDSENDFKEDKGNVDEEEELVVKDYETISSSVSADSVDYRMKMAE